MQFANAFGVDVLSNRSAFLVYVGDVGVVHDEDTEITYERTYFSAPGLLMKAQLMLSQRPPD
jgi:hypothetical protein